LPCRISQRRAAFDYYVKALAGLPGIQFLQEPAGSYSNRWLTTILIDPGETGGLSREDIRLVLEKENIDSRPLWKPMHLQPVFANAPAYVNGVSENLFNRGLCLPSGSNLIPEQLHRITALIRALWN